MNIQIDQKRLKTLSLNAYRYSATDNIKCTGQHTDTLLLSTYVAASLLSLLVYQWYGCCYLRRKSSLDILVLNPINLMNNF